MSHLISAVALARKAQSQDKLIAIQLSQANERIASGVSDAHAHAVKALTDTLRSTPDGRPTIAKIRRSASFIAARNRLAELAVDLAILVRTAREDFYVHEWEAWRDILPPEWLAGPDPGWKSARIKVAALARVRNAALHGERLESSIGAPISRMAIGLQTALAVAARRDLGRSDGTDVLKSWAKRSTDVIGGTVGSLLRDSMTFADKMAGRDVLKTEWLDDDPTLPE